MTSLSESPRRGLFLGFMLSFFGAVIFSTKAIIIKKAFRTAASVDALTLLMLRMAFASPFYMAAAWLDRRKGEYVRMTPRQWTWVAVLGLLGYHISSFFDFVGLQFISAGLERLILFLYPSFAVVINAVAFKQRMSKVQMLALVLTYAGIGIAYFGELKIDTGNPNFFYGSFLIFLCAITYAFYLSGTGQMVKVMAPSKFTTYSMLVATGGIFVHFLVRGWVSGNFHVPAASDHNLWICAVMLAIVATVIPSFMLTAGMKRIGANNAAIVTSIGPVSTILQAHFVLGEPIFFEQVLGTVLVIAGVLLIGWRSAR